MTPEAHRWAVGTGGSGSILRDGAAQCLSSARRERSGRRNPALGWPLPEPLSAPPPRFALPSRGDPAVGARVRAAAAAGGAARTSGRGPCPATRALSRVEKPRARAPRPPLPAAFPLRFFDDFLPEKKINLFARQVRSDQQAVVYRNVFIFLPAPPALYRLTVDVTFGISAHTQQLNGNKLSTFTSDKHYP